MHVINALAILGVVFWSLALVVTVVVIRYVRPLTQATSPPPTRWPSLSVVIPACNEGSALGPALTSHSRTDYPDVEFIVVDDRSTDATGAIADQFAASDPRIRAIHIRELPEGWLGKVHALATGLRETKGEWILFTDGDVKLAPEMLRLAVAHAETRNLDFLTVMPRLEQTSLLLDGICLMFIRHVLGNIRAWAIEDPKSPAALGIGAFCLFRRTAYDRSPGLEWLRLEITDDVGLAIMLKQAGARCAVANGCSLASLVYYESIRAMSGHFEKNSYASIGQFKLWRVVFMVSFLLAFDASAFAGFLPGGAAWAPWLSVVALVLAYTGLVISARWQLMRVGAAFVWPVSDIVLVAIILRSAYRGSKRDGIVWRGTFYSADKLRAHQRVKLP